MTEIQGGGPHDGTAIKVPADCVAVVIVTERPDGEYVASLATRGEVHSERLGECLDGLAHGRWRD
jgi:hypothetical protein